MFVFYQLYEIKPKQVYSNVPVLLSDDFFILLHKGFFWQNYMLEEYFRSSNMRILGQAHNRQVYLYEK